MNRPQIRSSFEAPAGHHQIPNSGHPPPANSVYPPPYDSASPGRSAPAPHYEGSRRPYDQLPPVHGLQQRDPHLHLPAVSTYIEHYHYYNFNGNCTVTQASSDGGPNTIRMVGGSVPQDGRMSRPQGDPPPPRPPPNVDVPPVPPPIRDPLPRNRDVGPTYSYPPEPSAPLEQDKRAGPAGSSAFASLPMSQLHPIPGSSRAVLCGPASSPLARQFMPSSRLGPPPSSGPDTRIMPSTPSSLLPRLRSSFDPGGPISLPPLQSPDIPSLRDDGKLGDGRPTKRSRISRTMDFPLSQDVGRGHPHGLPDSTPESKDVGDDHRAVQPRNGVGPPVHGHGPGAQTRYGIEPVGRNANNANSSSPSHGEYPMPGGRAEGGFERSDNVIPPPGPRTRAADETQVNDWEAVVDMYNTGRGTEDGVALRLITKGDGRRVSDRKLLEKRRTIGKTHEILGPERFEAAIGYKWENGARRKQKMYHVISRCRVVNAMRKANEVIPTDHSQLTAMIDDRIAQKEALKEAGKNGVPAGNNGAGPSGNRNGEIPYGNMGAGPSSAGGGMGPGPALGPGPVPSGHGSNGHVVNGHMNRNGSNDVVEDEIQRGGLHERERYG